MVSARCLHGGRWACTNRYYDQNDGPQRLWCCLFGLILLYQPAMDFPRCPRRSLSGRLIIMSSIPGYLTPSANGRSPRSKSLARISHLMAARMSASPANSSVAVPCPLVIHPNATSPNRPPTPTNHAPLFRHTYSYGYTITGPPQRLFNGLRYCTSLRSKASQRTGISIW